MDLLGSLTPPELTAWATGLLLVASAVTSFVTAAFGAGGGALLLGLMTVFMPVANVIPLHGIIQAGSNAGRLALTWRFAQWPLVAAFTAGSAVGALAGAQLVIRLPPGGAELALGLFLLWSCWGPMPAPRRGSRALLAVGGGATGLATLFVGATGPLVAALLRPLGLERHRHVGTFSACMVLQHGLKIAVFGLAGFAFSPYLPFLAAMLVTGFLGTLAGRRALARISDRGFHTALALILTALALRLLYTGATTL